MEQLQSVEEKKRPQDNRIRQLNMSRQSNSIHQLIAFTLTSPTQAVTKEMVTLVRKFEVTTLKL
ncbi:hypothetical protein RJ641_015221 [Dillenia turbinata]|uniref:Uncharacterized protein n=1 Tax=Dillenia turbinata TaxID=194707 RepID=A0AAN8V1L0_9MAGN